MGRNQREAKVAKAKAKLVVAPKSKLQTKPTRLSSKKNALSITRRSDRIRNVTPPARNQETEPVVEEINLCESEKEDEPHVEENHEDEPHVEENPHELVSAEERLEEKMDYLVQPVEKSKDAAKRHFKSDSPSADLKYKRLYFDSQKKIEALTNENYELSRKLEVALGKIEAYGDSSRVCSDLLGKLKDVLLISNLGKSAETAMKLSNQAGLCRCSSPRGISHPKASMKRKKNSK